MSEHKRKPLLNLFKEAKELHINIVLNVKVQQLLEQTTKMKLH